MSKVIFKFDKGKDLWNIWKTCNFNSNWHDFKKGLNSNILKIAEGKEFETCKKEIEGYFKKVHESKLISIFIEAINKSWNNINNEFFKRLEKITKKPICSKIFVGYMTTMGRCPYDFKEKSFMFSLFYSIPQVLQTVAHEIMHIQFHNTYWGEIEREIGKEKTADLKEALTVLLNLEFKDLLFVEDKGYKSHKKLRNFIIKEWKKEPDFNLLLDKCVGYLKKQGLGF